MEKVELPADIEKSLPQTGLLDVHELGELLRAQDDPIQVATNCLDWVVWYGHEHKKKVAPLTIQTLLDHGANPLLARHALNKHDTESSGLIMQAILLREATGSGYRTANGGNLLHQLAGDSFYNMEMFLKGEHFIGTIDPAWINTPDNAGVLPLQAMWNEARNRNVNQLWTLSSLFVERGADLTTVNEQGLNALDTIEDAMKNDPELEGRCPDDRIRALLEARMLDQCIGTGGTYKASIRRM
jgi:hypothetical protein